MTRQNIMTFIVVAFMALIVSYIATNSLFASSKNRQMEVEKVDTISADFPAPNKKYFNATSINPAQTIQIGGDQNDNPFRNVTPAQ